MALLLEWGEEVHFSCVCVVETVLLFLFLCSLLLPSDCSFFGLLLVQWECPPESQLLEFLQGLGVDVCGCRRMEGDSGIVNEDVCEDGM